MDGRSLMNANAVTDTDMTHPDWKDYATRLWASEWHLLFDVPDNRKKLTWRNIFSRRPATVKYYNFYSEGEEVLDRHIGTPNWYDMGMGILRQSGRYSWALQEKLKGDHPTNLIMGSNYGGWGFNNTDPDYYFWGLDLTKVPAPPKQFPISPEQANGLLPANLRSRPFFLIGNEAALFKEESGSLYALVNLDRLLADAIPARTLAAGKKEVAVLGRINEFNFDMQRTYLRVPLISHKVISGGNV